jgi:Flp pilus assembly pilin Flp
VAGLFRRLWREDEGQDMVEYALLAATIGLAAAASFQVILSLIGVAYRAWLGAIDGLWEPPAPGG